LVNNFVINTTEFLNKFSYLCEQKLAKVTADIERLEITMNILEAKLASIPGLEGAVEVKASSVVEEVPSGPAPTSYEPPQSNGIASEEEKEESENEIIPPAPVVSSGGLKVKDDPRYKSYFNLLRLGAPLSQIKMQMKAHGLDPSILDDPEAEASPGVSMTENETESNAPLDAEVDVTPPPPPPLPQNGKADESEESSSEED